METPSVSGRGGLLGLDASNPHDVNFIRETIRRRPKRWRTMDDEKKDAIVADLDAAREKARSVLDAASDTEEAMNAVAAISSIAKTMAVIEGQNQKDEIAEREAEVAQTPKEVNVRHYVVKPPRLLGEG